MKNPFLNKLYFISTFVFLCSFNLSFAYTIYGKTDADNGIYSTTSLTYQANGSEVYCNVEVSPFGYSDDPNIAYSEFYAGQNGHGATSPGLCNNNVGLWGIPANDTDYYIVSFAYAGGGNWSSSYWYKFYKDINGVIHTGWKNEQIPLDTSTHIISLTPPSDSYIIPFVATETDRFADFDVDELVYYNNATNSIAVISTTLSNNTLSSFTYSTTTISGFGYGEQTSSYNIAHNVPFGNYDLTITLLDSNLNLLDSTTSSNITFGTTSHAITFLEAYGASSSDIYNISQLATSSECSISNITGCFKNAIIWAFYPSEGALMRYDGLITVIKQKNPTGYFYIVKDILTGISTSTSKTFNIVLPSSIKTYIINPVDVGIASIIWIFFVFMFYKRLKKIQL